MTDQTAAADAFVADLTRQPVRYCKTCDTYHVPTDRPCEPPELPDFPDDRFADLPDTTEE